MQGSAKKVAVKCGCARGGLPFLSWMGDGEEAISPSAISRPTNPSRSERQSYPTFRPSPATSTSPPPPLKPGRHPSLFFLACRYSVLSLLPPLHNETSNGETCSCTGSSRLHQERLRLESPSYRRRGAQNWSVLVPNSSRLNRWQESSRPTSPYDS